MKYSILAGFRCSYCNIIFFTIHPPEAEFVNGYPVICRKVGLLPDIWAEPVVKTFPDIGMARASQEVLRLQEEGLVK